MQGGASFAEVLDGFLHTHVAGEQAAPPQAPAGPAPMNPFLFSTAYQRAPGSLPREYAAAAPPAAPRAARAARCLTPVQQRALDALIGLGAALSSDFTPQELRAAFRVLALRYHPDRHPFASAADVTVLAHTFTAITGHYEVLRGATATPAH